MKISNSLKYFSFVNILISGEVVVGAAVVVVGSSQIGQASVGGCSQTPPGRHLMEN